MSKTCSKNTIETIDENEDQSEENQVPENIIDGDEHEEYACSLVFRRLMYTSNKEEHPHTHNIFKTRYIVNDKICDVIIDSSSSKNIMYSSVV